MFDSAVTACSKVKWLRSGRGLQGNDVMKGCGQTAGVSVQ